MSSSARSRRLAAMAGHDRRPGGAQPRHDRRLDRQQRPGRRLSGRASSRSTPPCAPTSARSRPTISSPACSRPRSSRARSSPRCASRKPQSRELPEIPQPGLALRDRRRLRRPHRRRRARRGDRRRALRLPRPRDGSRARRSFTPDAIKDITIPDGRPQLRHPRQRRIPRPPRRRHGPPRRRGLCLGQGLPAA